MLKKLSFSILAIAGLLALAGCSSSTTPPMQLAHTAMVSKTYPSYGTIQINTFEDRRPSSQQVAHSTSGGNVPFSKGIVYTGSTIPTMPVYLQQVIAQEAQRSGIFSVTHLSPTYVMNGYITSMVVSYKTEPLNLPVTLNGNSTPVTLGGTPSFNVNIRYHVDIYKGDERVLSGDFYKTENIPYPDNDGTTPDNVISGQAENVLDQAVTQTVQQLFNTILAQGLS